MMTRTRGILPACVLAAAFAVPSAQAKVGVDEVTAPNQYNDVEGGFVTTSTDGNFKLLVGGRLQPAFDFISYDADGGDVDDATTFSVRRARLYFLGHVVNPKNRFFVQLAADSPSPWSAGLHSSDFELLDAWFKHEASETFGVKFGQFKVPFSRQNLTSSGRLQFVDRSLATEVLGGGLRDLGVEVSGGFNAGRVQYAGAITNGDGANTLNHDNNLAFMARLSVNPNGDYGYSEGDYEHRAEMASTLGAAVQYSENDEFGTQTMRLNFDGGIKVNGFSVQAEFYSVNVEVSNADVTTNGVYAQAGYFAKPEKLELVARWSRVMFDGDDNDASEISFGVNLFTWGHRLKWQAAYSMLANDTIGDSLTDHRGSFTGQVWF